jgi:hypothetical protein
MDPCQADTMPDFMINFVFERVSPITMKSYVKEVHIINNVGGYEVRYHQTFLPIKTGTMKKSFQSYILRQGPVVIRNNDLLPLSDATFAQSSLSIENAQDQVPNDWKVPDADLAVRNRHNINEHKAKQNILS